MDAKMQNKNHIIFKNGGSTPTQYSAEIFAKIVEEHGAGEILINSIDKDGMRNGYDIDLLNKVSTNVSIPVIGLGGVGEWSHLKEAFTKTKIDAVAAANIFHYTDQSVYLAKKYLFDSAQE